MKKNTTFSFNNRWLYTFCFYLITIMASAQNLELLRQASSGGYNGIVGSVTDDAGNLYVLGGYNGAITWGTFSLPTVASSETYLAKFDASGNCLWLKRAGGTSKAIAISGNSIYITGYFSGTINFNTPSATGSNELTNAAGGGDIFVAKFDDNGSFQWARRAGGTNSYVDTGESIAATNDGVYVVGSFNSTANFNTPTATGSNEITSDGVTDGFIAKFDINGDLQLLKRIGGTGFDECKAVAVKLNEIYVSGLFSGTANFNTPSASGTNELVSAGATDGFLIRLDNAGSVQWLRRFGSLKGENTTGLALWASDVYVSCNSSGIINFNTPSSFGSNEVTSGSVNYDAFVAKFNDSGSFQWAKRAGGFNTSPSTSSSKIVASNNAVFVTGRFSRTINFNNPSAAGSNELISAGTVSEDMFVAKYDGTGNFKWAKRGGGPGDDAGYSITLWNNSLYVLGGFTQTANFNTPSASGSNELTTTTITSYFAKYSAVSPPPSISTQPINAAVCENAVINFSIIAADASTYQWQISTNNGSSFSDIEASSIYSNVTTPTLTINNLTGLNSNQYRCVVVGESGTINSAAAILQLNPNSIVLVSPTDNINSNVGTKQAAQTISATNKILTSANVIYRAGNSIEFNAGFEAQSGSIFTAQIGGCN